MILAVEFANAGNANALDTAAAALGLKGVIVPVKDPAEIAPAIEMFAREPNGSLLAPADQTIVTTLCPGGKARMQRLMRLVKTGRIDLTRLLTHMFPLDEIDKAYELFASRREQVLKVAIRVS